MASNLITCDGLHLIAMAFNLIAMASNLIAMAFNLRAMASHLMHDKADIDIALELTACFTMLASTGSTLPNGLFALLLAVFPHLP